MCAPYHDIKQEGILNTIFLFVGLEINFSHHTQQNCTQEEQGNL